jgi:flagellar biosynthesis protein FlhA
MSLGEIQKVLSNLLRERVSIRNMVTILETLSSYISYSRDSSFLTEHVRVALSRQITGEFIDKSGNIYVITVDPDIESAIRAAVHEDPIEGPVLALDPESHNTVINAYIQAFNRAKKAGHVPVFMVSPQVRRVTFNMLEREIPHPVVISYSEIVSTVKVNVITSVLLS